MLIMHKEKAPDAQNEDRIRITLTSQNVKSLEKGKFINFFLYIKQHFWNIFILFSM